MYVGLLSADFVKIPTDKKYDVWGERKKKKLVGRELRGKLNYWIKVIGRKRSDHELKVSR